eukprot:m.242304 g.242304  ORF g.242304 m.242304 type:complete len:161 (-) comp14006_c0_seq1:101-583(-)
MSATSNSLLPLAGYVGAALVAGFVGSRSTMKSVKTWYVDLKKPPLNPPAWVFGPVWTTLYVLMGTAIWRIARSGAPEASTLVRVYFAQLAINALWSHLFFGLRRPAWALVDLAALWGTIVWMQAGIARIDGVAAALWAPYPLWVSFAGMLNWQVSRLNNC